MSRVRGTWRRLFTRTDRNATDTPVDERTLFAMATVIFLVQFPHLFHLPIWVSLLGGGLVGLRLWHHHAPHHKSLALVLSPVTVTLIAATAAVLLRLDYGYAVGRDPCVALLFVLVAAKFSEIRRASDATVLLCLSAFLLLTQYFYSQTILTALITLPEIVAMAFAMAVVRDPHNPATNAQQLRLVGKLLIQGLPLAAVLFVLFPRLPGPLWSLPEDALARTGLSDSMSPGSIGSLSKSNEVAFRVEFDGPPPPPHARYWRGPVLTEFDGRNWTVSEQNTAATPWHPPDAKVYDYTVMLQPHRLRWLFALDSAASLPRADQGANTDTPILGQLMADRQLIANAPVTSVLRYRQSSVLSNAMMPAHAPRASTLQLPGKNPKAIAFAEDLREQSTSDLDYAQRVLRHFNRDTFRYTLQPQLLGDAPVDEFLFDSKAGFCEHYSAAFVVMMRAADIPARVVTGYLGGEMNGDYMIVRQADAHAWAEAFIDGVWRRFDPTGHVAPSRVEQGLSAALPTESAVPSFARMDAGWLRSARLRWDALNHQWQRLVVDFDNDSQKSLWERLGLINPSLVHIVVLAMALSLAWGLFLFGMPSLNRSGLSRDEALWHRLCRLLSLNGFPRVPGESAAEYLQRVSGEWPRQRARLRMLSHDFTTLRFRRTDDTQAQRTRARIQRELLTLALGIRVNRWQRTRRPVANAEHA